MTMEGTNTGSLTDLQCKTIKTSVKQQHPGNPQAPHIVYIWRDWWFIVYGQVLHNKHYCIYIFYVVMAACVCVMWGGGGEGGQ